ncbi:MAG: dipeptidase [Clostridia bacterium]|nr:dipeptidase [Clostridia bacterium]
MADQAVDPRALALHQRAVVVDTHQDTLEEVVAGRRTLGERSASGHADLPRLKEAGVDVVLFSHWTRPTGHPGLTLQQVLHKLSVFWRECAANAADVAPVAGTAELEAALAAGRVAGVVSMEGLEAIGDDPGLLEVLYRLGVRVASLTWNERNALADGAGQSETKSRLTRAGREAVREMNRLGIVVDVSHLSEGCFWDVLETGSRPPIASHSNARALCDHPRNLSDEQVRALAAAGGVVGVTFVPGFLVPEGSGQRATLETVIAHIEHLVSLVGPEHVGLGSDFDGTAELPSGLEDVTRLPALTEALLRRGYGEEAVTAILGGNHLRIFRQVWRA